MGRRRRYRRPKGRYEGVRGKERDRGGQRGTGGAFAAVRGCEAGTWGASAAMRV